MRGPATCPHCRRVKYLIVKRRYQQSPKGIAVARAREEREDVLERRRQFSRSPSGRRNKAKYEATVKGQRTRAKAIAKYRASDKARVKASERHRATRLEPRRKEQRQRANARYKRTAKGKAMKYRQYAKRKGAMLASENPLTAAEWLAILQAAKHRCHYCRKKRKLTIDHVIPLSKGGQHTRMNVVPACQPCNSQKRDRILTMF